MNEWIDEWKTKQLATDRIGFIWNNIYTKMDVFNAKNKGNDTKQTLRAWSQCHCNSIQ